jgi:hypothetical protein
MAVSVLRSISVTSLLSALRETVNSRFQKPVSATASAASAARIAVSRNCLFVEKFLLRCGDAFGVQSEA